MRKPIILLGVAAVLVISGCSDKGSCLFKPNATGKGTCTDRIITPTTATKKLAKIPSKPHIQKVFKKGSKVCKWTTHLNGVKGTDYFYKDKSAKHGSADRVIGDTTLLGTWKITGPAINLNFYGGKKGKGSWYKVKSTGKKSFDLYTGQGQYAMSMKCK